MGTDVLYACRDFRKLNCEGMLQDVFNQGISELESADAGPTSDLVGPGVSLFKPTLRIYSFSLLLTPSLLLICGPSAVAYKH